MPSMSTTRRGEASTVASLILLVKVPVHGVDKGEVNCLSSFVSFEAAWYQPSFSFNAVLLFT